MELNKKWYQNADDMAEAFSSINSVYPKEEIRKMLYEHLRLKEILQMSRFFVNGIVRQFPNLF